MNPATSHRAILFACLFSATAAVFAQAPANGSTQKPPAQQPPPQSSPGSSNPFPEDTSNVPIMPSKSVPDLPADTDAGSAAPRPVSLPNADADPVRSPDDPNPAAETAPTESSSTVPGMDRMTDPGDDDQQGKHRKMAVKPPEHVETSKEDLDVGGYYLEKKNWKAALSRFQSALVLAPEEPEVYWGLAESQRNLGQFADARANYQKVLDFDPDGPHGKAARKALKEPEIANAKSAPQTPSTNQSTH
jgi:tetratricopeptide repeat protein